MCLGVPAEIVGISEDVEQTARVHLDGVELDVSTALLETVRVGDYVLVHAGFAIQTIDSSEVDEVLETQQEFIKLNQELDEEERITGKRIV